MTGFYMRTTLAFSGLNDIINKRMALGSNLILQ